jgi:hypothetical protein
MLSFYLLVYRIGKKHSDKAARTLSFKAVELFCIAMQDRFFALFR